MQPLRFGRHEILPAQRRLLVDGRPAAVGSRAFDLLIALIERRGRAVTKAELLEIVWPGVVVEENNLQVHISALRKLLGADVIATIPGRGYCFSARLDGERAPAPPPAEATGAQASTNLPERLPPLYGREEDLRVLHGLIGRHALVTVVGAAGIGKTRLATAAAHALRGRHANGTWMVEMAAINDAALVLPTLAKATGLVLAGRASPMQELLAALKPLSMLIVLDNCEHLLDAVSEIVQAILQDAPDVRILATSQELLRVRGEQLFRLPPLAVPQPRDAARAGEFGAVRLFVERVRGLDAGFELQPSNVDDVTEICARLDGIALALELAAARVPMLGVAGIRERLNERFHTLTGGARLSLRRHQTLRAALDWSHNLLNAREQQVFRRLGVFAGGFHMDSAQRLLCAEELDEWAVLELLGALVDKSLVLAEGGARPRYRMLETARSYALEKLAEAGETDDWLRRHALTTQAVLERAVKRRDADLLAQEMNNVRAAFAWATGLHGDRRAAVALATASSVVLAVEGFVVEGLERLLKVQPHVDAGTPPALAAQYWQWLGRLGIDGRLPVSRCVDALRRAEAMFREQGNARHLHACLRMRAEALLDAGSPQGLLEAQAALDEAAAMEEANRPWPLADCMRRLRVQGLLLAALNRPEDALALLEQAYRMAESASIERYVISLLSDMAGVHLAMGHKEVAGQQFEVLARMARSRPSHGLVLCYALVGLTAALVAGCDLAGAHAVATEAVPLLRRCGIFVVRGDIFAWLLACSGHPAAAARLLGAADAARLRGEAAPDTVERHARRMTAQLLALSCEPQQVLQWMAEGAQAGEDELAALVLQEGAPGLER